MSGSDSIRVSVCVAAYNGQHYLEEQLSSILDQLTEDDEIVVVDDHSRDATGEVVDSMADPRIRLVHNEQNLGYVRTFERALTLARGEYLLLSDQDDVWLPGRVQDMVVALQESQVVASNFSVFGGTPNRFHQIRLRAADSRRYAANLFFLWVGIRPYYGCTMGIRRSALDVALPFPGFLTETHDQWLAMCGNVMHSMRHLERDTVSRRLHDSNTTPKRMRSLRKIVAARWMLLRALRVAKNRVRQTSGEVIGVGS